MEFYDLVDKVVELLERPGRLSYRALKREFDFDDALLEELKFELLRVQGLAADQGGAILIWRGRAGAIPSSVGSPDDVSTPPGRSGSTGEAN